jgi:type II secretory pathway component PulM
MRLNIYFLQDMAPARRKQLYRIMALLFVGLWVVVFMSLSSLAESEAQDIERLKRRHSQITPLVQQVVTLQAKVGALASMSPLAAAQQVSRDLKLEKQLATVRPTQFMGGQEGVQLLYESLTMPQTMRLLETIQTRSGMKVVSFVINHRMDNPQRGDLQLVLVR